MYNISELPEEISFIYFMVFVVLAIPSVLLASHDYKKTGKLSKAGAFILTFCGIVQGGLAASVTFCSAYKNHTDLMLITTGILLNLAGFVMILIAIINFKSFRRTFGRDTNRLVTNGIYAYSRNPQYVGYVLMQIGWIVGWWTKLAIIALITCLIYAYIAARLEERNLRNIYTKEFEEYCKRVPRFLGI